MTLLIIIAVIISDKDEHKSETFDARSVQARNANSIDGGINSFEASKTKKNGSSTPATDDEVNNNAFKPNITTPPSSTNTNTNSSISINKPLTDSLPDAPDDDTVDLIEDKVENTIPESFFDLEIDLLVFFDQVRTNGRCLCNIYSYDPLKMKLNVVNTFNENLNFERIIFSSDRKKIAFHTLNSIYVRNVTDKSDSKSKLVFTSDGTTMHYISKLSFSANGEEIAFVCTCPLEGFPLKTVPQIFKIKIDDLNVEKVKKSLVKFSDFNENLDIADLMFVSVNFLAFCMRKNSYFSLFNVEDKTITDLKSLSNTNVILKNFLISSEESKIKIILMETKKKEQEKGTQIKTMEQKKETQIFSVCIDSFENIIKNESNYQTSLSPIEKVNLAVINELFVRPILSSKGNFILYKPFQSEIYKVVPIKPTTLTDPDGNSVESSESKSISEIQILNLESADQN